MTPIANYETLLREIMQLSLDNGCSACKMTLETYEGTKIDMLNGDIDTLKQSCSNGLLIRLYLPDGRSNVVATNRLDKQELENLVRQSIETARLLAPDAARTLPDIKRCYRHDGKTLDQFDTTFFEHSIEEKTALVKKEANELKNKECIMSRCIYTDSVMQDLYLTSHGLCLTSQTTQYAMTTMVTLKGLGDDRPNGSDFCHRITFEEMLKAVEPLAATAWQRAKAQIAPRVSAQGNMSIVVDTHCVLTLVEPLLDAASGSALQQHNSFLQKHHGKRIGSDLFNLIDIPHKKHTLGARLYDSEGLATHRRYFIHNGILRSYFINTYHANKMKMKPTCDEPSVLVMPKGTLSLQEMLASIDNGIYITDFIGGNCNDATGDFSFGITGFIVKDGKIGAPLVGQNLSGNMLTFWQQLAAVANDADRHSSVQIPSLLFTNINIA